MTYCITCSAERPCVSPHGLNEAGWQVTRLGWRCPKCSAREGSTFTVDVCLDEEWLANALAAARAGKPVRVSVVVSGAGPHAKYKARACGGGEAEYLVAGIAGDFTREPAWAGE